MITEEELQEEEHVLCHLVTNLPTRGFAADGDPAIEVTAPNRMASTQITLNQAASEDESETWTRTVVEADEEIVAEGRDTEEDAKPGRIK